MGSFFCPPAAGPQPDFFTMECSEIMTTEQGYNQWIEKLDSWFAKTFKKSGVRTIGNLGVLY